MEVTETLSEGLKRELKIVVPAQDLDAAIERRLVQMSKTVQLKGFRPGMVPLAVVRKRYHSAVLGEVIEKQIQEQSAKAIADRQVRPATQPKVEITSYDTGKDLEFKMGFEILPSIELGNFADIAVTRETSTPGDGEIGEALQRIADSERRYRKVDDRAAAKDDQLLIDFAGSISGLPFEGGAASDFEIVLGSGALIPGFEDQLAGAKAGEARTVNVTFPAEYPAKEFAGKDAQFAITVKEVRERDSSQIDDELAKRFQHESLEAMRAAVRERLVQEYQNVSRAKLKRTLLDELAKRYSFGVPEAMVEQEFEQIWNQIKAEVERDKSSYEAVIGKPEEAGKTEYREIAERRVRLGLLLAEVGRQNGVTVEREDLLQAALQSARSFAQPKQVLDFYRSNPNALDRFRAPVFEEKTVDHLLKQAKISEQAVTPTELLKDPDEDEAGSASA
ncbi:MAG: trigger factor [Alphaproteobacteria bacterium]|nr:trigger factor [Alphaproteobacteria bacterium]